MDNETTKSQFNAGVGQALEVRGIQNMLNKAKLDLLAINMNPEYPQIINYELVFGLLTGMFREVEPKCTTKEKDKITALMNTAEKFIEKYPIVSQNNRGQTNIDANALKVYKKILADYEVEIRLALDTHELNSPSKSDASKSIIQM